MSSALLQMLDVNTEIMQVAEGEGHFESGAENPCAVISVLSKPIHVGFVGYRFLFQCVCLNGGYIESFHIFLGSKHFYFMSVCFVVAVVVIQIFNCPAQIKKRKLDGAHQTPPTLIQ